MELLKLVALDPDDLSVISAHLQDALLRMDDLAWLPEQHRFVLVARRFDHERGTGETPHRRLVGVNFERVLNVKTKGIVPNDSSDAPSSLLAVGFEAGEPPSGIATLLFAGEMAVRLELECVEVRMRDLGPVWESDARPDHDLAIATAEARRILLQDSR